LEKNSLGLLQNNVFWKKELVWVPRNLLKPKHGGSLKETKL
jgi:hypothetical protein